MYEICISPWQTEVLSILEKKQMKMQHPDVAEADKDQNELNSSVKGRPWLLLQNLVIIL